MAVTAHVFRPSIGSTMNTRRALSLLEMLAVAVILGIIAVIILPRVMTSSKVSKEKTCYSNRAEINSAVERYYLSKGVWPANNLSNIRADKSFFPEGIPTCPVSGRQYRLNRTTHRVIGHTNSGNHAL